MLFQLKLNTITKSAVNEHQLEYLTRGLFFNRSDCRTVDVTGKVPVLGVMAACLLLYVADVPGTDTLSGTILLVV